jgi:uncharacterized membrane protein
MMQDITDQDKLMAALAWLIPVIIPARILLVEELKGRPFQRYHAVQSLAFYGAVLIVSLILAVLTFWVGGCGGCLGIPLWAVAYYYAFRAYQGDDFEIPIITEFIQKQGWL